MNEKETNVEVEKYFDTNMKVTMSCAICHDPIKEVTVGEFLNFPPNIPLCNNCKKKHYEMIEK